MLSHQNDVTVTGTTIRVDQRPLSTLPGNLPGPINDSLPIGWPGIVQPTIGWPGIDGDWTRPSDLPYVPDPVPYHPPLLPAVINPPSVEDIVAQLMMLNAMAKLQQPLVWRVKRTTDQLVASCDLPGVLAGDVSLSLVLGTLRICARRADTGTVIEGEHPLGRDVDASTATATLELGVLTVTVGTIPDRTSGPVAVVQR